MPKVYLSEREQMCSRLSKWVYGEMKVRKLSQVALADRMGISHQALSRKLRKASFDYADFLFFVKEFEPDNTELLRLIGI